MNVQLAMLRRHLLPGTFSPTGFYKNPDRVSVKALGVDPSDEFREVKELQAGLESLDTELDNLLQRAQ